MGQKGQIVACLVIIWDIKHETKEKQAEKNLSGLEKYTFVYSLEKEQEIRKDKNKDIFLFLKELQGLFLQVLYYKREALKQFYRALISQIQLSKSYWKSRASKQTDLPISCKINNLLINMLSFKQLRSAENNSPQFWVTRKQLFFPQLFPIIHLPAAYLMGKETIIIILNWALVQAYCSLSDYPRVLQQCTCILLCIKCTFLPKCVREK